MVGYKRRGDRGVLNELCCFVLACHKVTSMSLESGVTSARRSKLVRTKNTEDCMYEVHNFKVERPR